MDLVSRAISLLFAYSDLADGGLTDLNVAELRPPQMDLSGRTKYPVLFQV